MRTASNNCIQECKFGRLLHENGRICPFFDKMDDKINNRTGTGI